ncbi:nuclear transport factor 2 family protein [Anaeromyxobacter oryzae]|uniref:DUF4440 domain-containing protein n=1 Tax=Anaeromyxobacter oryzae TaxID=2918170 RepID=A0ABM7X2E9_9BACT|nr:nuclear transport factor 2 family protein [Anaeromyxobacter oryzae]BDG05965.1 hypothetical protein AMOR_49610 [Anaeromyxobacter oryzae]
MKKLAFAALVLAMTGPAFAQADKPQASAENPMARWKPPKVTNEQKDRKEIQAVLKQLEAAGKKGDIDAAAALLDFPVLMVTDDSKGQAMADSWTKEKWVEQMGPVYKQPMPAVTNKPTITLLSDSLAIVTNQWSTTMGKQKVSARDALQLVRVDGKWRIKSMIEGGWGDMMGPASAASTGGASPTGTGASSTGSSTETGAAAGTGASTETGTPSGTGSSAETGKPSGTGPSTETGAATGTGSSTGAGSTETAPPAPSAPSPGAPPEKK